jgi:hypothetical protein
MITPFRGLFLFSPNKTTPHNHNRNELLGGGINFYFSINNIFYQIINKFKIINRLNTDFPN